MLSELRQAQQAQTRHRLVAAAHQCFSDRGLAKTTIDDIVKRAGTSRATFYLHFQGKPQVLAASWDEIELPRVNRLFVDHDAGADFSYGATRVWIERLLTFWEANPTMALNANQIMASDDELLRWGASNVLAVAQHMPNLVARLGANAQSWIVLRVTQLERLMYFWVTGNVPLSREELLEALSREWALDG